MSKEPRFKLKNPVRFSVDIEAEVQRRLQDIADYYHAGNRQEVVRQAIGEFLSKFSNLVVFKCAKCGWSFKSDGGGEAVKRLIKDHECEKKKGKV